MGASKAFILCYLQSVHFHLKAKSFHNAFTISPFKPKIFYISRSKLGQNISDSMRGIIAIICI